MLQGWFYHKLVVWAFIWTQEEVLLCDALMWEKVTLTQTNA